MVYTRLYSYKLSPSFELSYKFFKSPIARSVEYREYIIMAVQHGNHFGNIIVNHVDLLRMDTLNDFNLSTILLYRLFHFFIKDS